MIYVDTSVIVALLTVEPGTQDVTAWYAGLRDTPACSDWLLTEFSSALSIKLRSSARIRMFRVSRGADRFAADVMYLHASTPQ